MDPLLVPTVLLGLVLGSFFNVCIYRIPRGVSLVFPPSSCPGCGHRLYVPDLIPLLSWIWLRGRCRFCGVKISWRYPLVEAITAVILTGLYLEYGVSWTFLFWAVLSSVLIIVTLIDQAYRIIPNTVLSAGLVMGVLVAVPIAGFDGGWWRARLIAMLAGGGFLLLLHLLSRGGMGLGDVKLAGLMGFYMGFQVFVALLLAFVSGALAGGLLLILGRKKRKDAIAFGPFMAAGGLVTIFWGESLVNWYASRFLF